MTTLELPAVAVTLLAVYLTARQKIWCWPLGMLSVSLYAVVFYQARLYADMGLQALYFALSIYGWWAWLRGGRNHGELQVSVASARVRWGVLLVATVAGWLLGTSLERFTNASLPYLDSTLTTFSIAAQFLQTRKMLEAWLIWLAVDLLYVGMFLYKGLYPTAALYAAFLYLAGLGFVRWRDSMATAPAVLGALP